MRIATGASPIFPAWRCQNVMRSSETKLPRNHLMRGRPHAFQSIFN